jgi:hypothetical protein
VLQLPAGVSKRLARCAEASSNGIMGAAGAVHDVAAAAAAACTGGFEAGGSQASLLPDPTSALAPAERASAAAVAGTSTGTSAAAANRSGAHEPPPDTSLHPHGEQQQQQPEGHGLQSASAAGSSCTAGLPMQQDAVTAPAAVAQGKAAGVLGSEVDTAAAQHDAQHGMVNAGGAGSQGPAATMPKSTAGVLGSEVAAAATQPDVELLVGQACSQGPSSTTPDSFNEDGEGNADCMPGVSSQQRGDAAASEFSAGTVGAADQLPADSFRRLSEGLLAAAASAVAGRAATPPPAQFTPLLPPTSAAAEDLAVQPVGEPQDSPAGAEDQPQPAAPAAAETPAGCAEGPAVPRDSNSGAESLQQLSQPPSGQQGECNLRLCGQQAMASSPPHQEAVGGLQDQLAVQTMGKLQGTAADAEQRPHAAASAAVNRLAGCAEGMAVPAAGELLDRAAEAASQLQTAAAGAAAAPHGAAECAVDPAVKTAGELPDSAAEASLQPQEVTTTATAAISLAECAVDLEVQAAFKLQDSTAGAELLQPQPAAPAATNRSAGCAEDMALQPAGEPQDSAAGPDSLQRLMEQLSLCSQPQEGDLGVSDQHELGCQPPTLPG